MNKENESSGKGVKSEQIEPKDKKDRGNNMENQSQDETDSKKAVKLEILPKKRTTRSTMVRLHKLSAQAKNQASTVSGNHDREESKATSSSLRRTARRGAST